MEVTGKRGAVSRRVRLADLARRVGVSVATVSRALSGSAGVRPELVEKIRAAAREFNYALPSAVAGQRVAVIASSAAMVDYARSQFALDVVDGLRARAEQLRLEIALRTVVGTEQEREALLAAEADSGLAGVFLLAPETQLALPDARRLGKPVVVVNGEDPEMQLCSIAPANRSAAAAATRYLQGLGHRRILFLSRPGRQTIRRRLEGWRDAMGEVSDDPALRVDVDDWLPQCAAAAISSRLDGGRPDFSAILAAGDSLAAGALSALAKAGIKVPDDMSVIGMDGLPQGALLVPPLSAMELPRREIGAGAVDLMCELMTGLPRAPRHIQLGYRLVERGSTAAAPH